MPGADASRGRLIFRPETVWNEVPPANAATTRLRITGESLHHRNSKVISEEIRSDQQRDNDVLVGYDVDGGFNAELTYGNFDWLLEAILGGSWTTNVLMNGTTKRSFTLEKGFLDITKYISYRGCRVNTVELNTISRRIVELAASFMGAKGYPTTSSLAGTTAPTEPNGNQPIAAGPNIKLYAVGGSNEELNDVETKEIRLNLNRNLRIRDQATSVFTDDFGYGAMDITGTLNVYFADIVHYTSFVNDALFSLAWTLSDPDVAASSYRITLPKLKIEDAQPALAGVESDVMMPINFRAFNDTGVGYSIKIERAVTPP